MQLLKTSLRFNKVFWASLAILFVSVAAFNFNHLVSAQAGPQQPQVFNISGSFAPLAASLTGQTSVALQSGVYSFVFNNSDGSAVKYEIDTNDPDVQKGLLKIKDANNNSFIVTKAGTRYRKLDGTILNPDKFSTQNGLVITFTHQLWTADKIVSLNYDETFEGITTTKQFDISSSGGALVIQAYAVNPRSSPYGNYAGFEFGQSDQTANPENVSIPDIRLAPITMVDKKFFYSAYFDIGRSNSNESPLRQGPSKPDADSFINSYAARYIPGFQNAYTSFNETIYITASPNVQHTFFNINRSPSIYRSDLSKRIVIDLHDIIDINYKSGETYAKTLELLTKLHDFFRLDNLAVISHTSYLEPGKGVAKPKAYPPGANYGTVADLRKLSDSARSFGYLLAPLHENYANFMVNYKPYWQDFCINDGVDDTQDPTNPNAPSMPVILNPSGQCAVAGWWTPNFQDGSHIYNIAPDKMLFYAQDQGPQIETEINPNASYLDVSPKIAIKDLVDYAANNPNSQTIQSALKHSIGLSDYKESLHGGPVFGEGGQSAFSIDVYGNVNVEGEIEQGEFAPFIPDFDLLVRKTRLVNQGMGYYERWINNQSGSGNAVDDFTYAQWLQVKDKYNATAIGFNRAGFVSDSFLQHHDQLTPKQQLTESQYLSMAVKGYYLMRDLQEQYLSSPINQILYLNSQNQLVDLNQILKDNSGNLNPSTPQSHPLYNAQVKMSYQNGLDIYMNRHQTAVWSVTVSGITYYLPPNGWLAVNPNLEFLQYSALVKTDGTHSANGKRVDYVKSRNYIMVDGRGVETVFGPDFNGNQIKALNMEVYRPGNWVLFEQPDGSFSLNVAPVITTLDPTAILNTQHNLIKINGSNFEFSSQIKVDGNILLSQWTIFYSTQEMAMFFPAGVAPAGTYTATVYNPSSGLESNALTFESQNSAPPPPPGGPPPPPTPPPSRTIFTINLYQGLTHSEVNLLQICLKRDASIYPEGIVSGYFGQLTEKAVQRFQTKYNIVSYGSPSTTGYGFVGPRTRENLNLVCVGSSTPPPAPPPSGSAPFTKELEFGMTDPQIVTLQQFLARNPALYPQGIVTGYFGSLTQAAVTNFQAKYGIATVGRVGPITMSKLNELYVSGNNP